jgi:hypothetical protein
MQLKNENGKTIIIFDELLSITHIERQQNTYQEALRLAKPIAQVRE